MIPVATQPTPASELDHRLRGLAPGWRFAGRYRMENLVGRGGMGVVWCATDETLERPVALKFLVETLLHDPMAIDDLKRETRRALELTHHNIVRVYDFVEDQSQELAGIAMEFFPGQTLSARRVAVATRCFEPEMVTPWLAQLCDAMAYAHEKVGVIHRDLKPQNLMLDNRGELKITDFGIARVASDSLTRISIGKVSGTPCYMSPQQSRGEAPKVSDDIYAIGATIYELLTSRPPFWQGNIPMQLASIVPPTMTERLRELTGIERDIPAAWEETVASCLSKDANRRPQSARELAERLGITLPSTHYHTSTTFGGSTAPPPIPEPARNLAELEPDLDLEAPTMVGATIHSPATSVREVVSRADTEARIPPPLPTTATPRSAQFPIPRGLLIGGIGLTLAILALAGGAMLRHFTSKPDTAVAPGPVVEANVGTPGTPSQSDATEAPEKLASIQAAIDAAKPGETITIRPGIYREALTLKDGVSLRGEDAATCRIIPPDGSTSGITARGVRGCGIDSLLIEGSPSAPADSRVDGIAISDAEVNVTRCSIRGMTGAGIVVHGTDTSAKLDANKVESNTLAGIMLLRTGPGVILRKNEARQNKGPGISFEEGANGRAEENICEKNGESGIAALGVATSPSLQANQCNSNGGHGILFTGAARGEAIDNLCEANAESGIAAVGEGTAPKLIRNTARQNTGYGILFAGGADGSASENLCENNQTSGIGAANTSTRPALSRNQLARNQEFGIDISNGASPRITPDNIFTANVAGEISK